MVENTTTCMESETGKRAHSMEGVMWELSRLCYICDGDVQDCEETEKVWIETYELKNNDSVASTLEYINYLKFTNTQSMCIVYKAQPTCNLLCFHNSVISLLWFMPFSHAFVNSHILLVV